VVEIELQSVTDNPLIFTDGDSAKVMSGAHFHGAILALPADYLRSALTELASISERRIARAATAATRMPCWRA
jgi:histidine ammonia-lyase